MDIPTIEDYDKAIEALQEARKQLFDGTQGEGCGVCGGACWPDHCGHNPMYAVLLCKKIADESVELHNALHYLAGFRTLMGEQVGPASICIYEPVNPNSE